MAPFDAQPDSRPLLECLGEGVALLDEGGMLLSLNPAGCEVLGADAVGGPVAGLFQAAEAERLERHARLSAGGLRTSFECTLADGERQVAVTASPYPGAERPMSLWLLRDVTERRHQEARLQDDLHGMRQVTGALRTENGQLRQQLEEYATELMRSQEALWNSESLYARLVETSPDAIVLLGQQLCVQMSNRQAAVLFGLAEDETLSGRYGWEFLAREDGRRFLERLDRDLRKSLGSARQEVNLRRLDGATFPGELSAAAIVTPAGKVLGTVLVLRDVSERKTLEAELFHSQKMEAVGRLASGIAHDFNNLLMVIRGSAELVGRRLGECQHLARPIRQIERAAVRGAALVEHLMTFSRRREGEQQLFTANHVVADLRPMLEHALTSDIRLEVTLDEQDVAVRLTPSSLEQVLLNLVINARDAMPDGGVVRISTRAVAACSAVETGGGGHGARDDGGGEVADLRAVLHDEGRGQGDRAGTLNRVRHCEAGAGHHPGGVRAGQGHTVLPDAAGGRSGSETCPASRRRQSGACWWWWKRI